LRLKINRSEREYKIQEMFREDEDEPGITIEVPIDRRECGLLMNRIRRIMHSKNFHTWIVTNDDGTLVRSFRARMYSVEIGKDRETLSLGLRK